MNTNNNLSAGRGFRVKNPPSAGFAPGAGEVSDRGASLEEGTTHGQKNDRRSLSSKNRNYNKTLWTIGEKEIIYKCFSYSRNVCWGRKKDAIFEQQVKSSDLPRSKIEETTLLKLKSITSQIKKYLTAEVMTEIDSYERIRAEEDFKKLSEEEKLSFNESLWTRREKWTLLWSISYAETKFTKQKDRSKE